MILALDTSSLNTSIALLKDDEVLECREQFEETHQQSKVIFRLMKDLLDSQQLSPDQITALAVGVGPGSYTGLRVGMSIVMSWAFAKNLPVYKFSSKEILNRSGASKDRVSLKSLLKTDLVRVSSLSELKPVYEKDHFA